MFNQSSRSHKLFTSVTNRFKRLINLQPHLIQPILTIAGASCFTLITFLLLLLIEGESYIQAAPSIRPLTDTSISTTHTTSTTHQMRVFGDGRITNQYLNDDVSNRNQIDQLGDDISATTLAIMFDQHTSTANPVDVGVHNDFYMSTPITLNDPSSIPRYSEDSYVVYASKVLSYQITQRTLTTDTTYGDWLIMELIIHNTGNTSLTGGKLLYMMDIDAAANHTGDEGFFDTTRSLVYQADQNGPGYAMGISLLEGNLRGYGVRGDGYPSSDIDIKNQLLLPANSVLNGDNSVSWLVIDLPMLATNQETKVSFSLCAKTGTNQNQAVTNLFRCFEKLTTLSVSKRAIPFSGSIIIGQPITYNIVITNTGVHYVDNIVVTDTIPAFTNLVTYSVSQGSITEQNGFISASIGRLYPASNPATVTLVVTPSASALSGTIISNQAFVKSDKGITATNIITHKITTPGPNLVITKTDERETVKPGDRVTYILDVSNTSFQEATGIIVRDIIPTHTTLYRSTDGGVYNSGTRTVTWPHFNLSPGESTSRVVIVDVNNPLPTGVDFITNTARVTDDGNKGPDPNPTDNVAKDIDFVDATPNLGIAKTDQLTTTQPSKLLTYTLTISNIGNQEAIGVLVTDILPTHTSFVSASNGGITVNGRVTWPTFNLAAGPSVTRMVVVRVNETLPASATTITNTATVANDNSNGIDPTPGNNTAYDKDGIIKPPHITMIYLPVIFDNYAPTFCIPTPSKNYLVNYQGTFTVQPIVGFVNRYVLEADIKGIGSYEHGLTFGHIGSKFYRFGIKPSNQEFRLKRNFSNDLLDSQCINKPEPCWVKDTTITSNFNHLKVECNSNAIKLFLNNKSEPIWQRNNFDCSGGLGFFMQSTNPNAKVHFNNFQVSCPFGIGGNNQSSYLPFSIITSTNLSLDK